MGEHSKGPVAPAGALSIAQADYLVRALDLRERFEAGIFPTGPGQWSVVRALVRRGFLVFQGVGRDIDGEAEGEVDIYRLTEAGIAKAREVDGGPETRLNTGPEKDGGSR